VWQSTENAVCFAGKQGSDDETPVFSEDTDTNVGDQASEPRRTTRPIFAVGSYGNADVCYELGPIL
jgi:hypothetical protein